MPIFLCLKEKETPKGLSFWYNLSMQTPKLNHKNYSKFSTVRQLVLPLDYSQMIPETESVRLLDAVLEELNYTALLRLYSPLGENLQYRPRSCSKLSCSPCWKASILCVPSNGSARSTSNTCGCYRDIRHPAI